MQFNLTKHIYMLCKLRLIHFYNLSFYLWFRFTFLLCHVLTQVISWYTLFDWITPIRIYNQRATRLKNESLRVILISFMCTIRAGYSVRSWISYYVCYAVCFECSSIARCTKNCPSLINLRYKPSAHRKSTCIYPAHSAVKNQKLL